MGRLGKTKRTIDFVPVPIPLANGTKPKFKIFYAYKNGRSEAREAYFNLDSERQQRIYSILKHVVKIGDTFHSDGLKWNLHNYSYGEIRPMPHRFFFFRAEKDCLVFFAHAVKRVNSFNNSFYKNLQKKKDEYEAEFKKRTKSNR